MSDTTRGLITSAVKRLINEDLKKYSKNFGDAFILEAQSTIDQFAKETIAEYYEGYTPRMYERTGQMGGVSESGNKSWSEIGEAIGNKKYSGGIIINFDNPSTSHDLWNSEKEEDIYEFVWNRNLHPVWTKPIGYHKPGYNFGPYKIGRVQVGFKGKSRDNVEVVRKRAYAALEEVTEKAMQTAKSKRYSIIKFS